MAVVEGVYSGSKKTLTIQDYTVTPNSISVDLIVGSWSAPAIDAINAGEILKSSASGQIRHAAPVMGIAGAQKVSFKAWAKDKKNDTDKNVFSLVRGLSINSVAGTGHSSETYTNQLVGLGKLMCKLVLVETNEAGTATTTTYPVMVDLVTEILENDTLAIQVDCTLLGAITRA